MIATIVKGPHILFTSDAGHKTYGITVRATGPEAVVEKAGKRREWDINDMTIRERPDRVAEALGLSREEMDALHLQVTNMVAAQV
jgi:3-methyladenine DNA glycosylase Mpg